MNNLDKSLQFYTQETFNRNTWFKISSIDYLELINQWNFPLFFKSYSSLNLLDIGCGTGKFPSILSSHLVDSPLIQTDFLDPSAFCLQEYKKNLSHPFVIRKGFLAPIEQFSGMKNEIEKYDLIWALHSLYCVEKESLSTQIQYVLNLLSNKKARFLIYIANSKSSYYLIKNQYDRIINSPKSLDFVWSEDIENALGDLAIPFNKKTITFHHSVEKKNIHYYLNQCVFNNQIHLTDWIFSHPLKKWLDLHYDGKKYTFPQEVVLLECLFTPISSSTDNTR